MNREAEGNDACHPKDKNNHSSITPETYHWLGLLVQCSAVLMVVQQRCYKAKGTKQTSSDGVTQIDPPSCLLIHKRLKWKKRGKTSPKVRSGAFWQSIWILAPQVPCLIPFSFWIFVKKSVKKSHFQKIQPICDGWTHRRQTLSQRC